MLPAHNEESNIGKCIDDLLRCFIEQHGLDVEVIVVNDNSVDATEQAVLEKADRWRGIVERRATALPEQQHIRSSNKAKGPVRLVRRNPPGGFGRAVRTGLEYVTGAVVIVYMSDCSDHPEDAYRYYQKIQDGYDCVYGSRFIAGATVNGYPKGKLIVNRIVNKAIEWMFWTEMNDLTNAFKAYRREVIKTCGPYKSCHFNITLEMSLGALIAGYQIAEIPISWEGRTWGSTNLRMREMGRRYLCTLLMLFFQRLLMSDDVRSETFGRATDATEIRSGDSSAEQVTSPSRSR